MREDQGNSGNGLISADFGNDFGSQPRIVKHAEPQSLVDKNGDTQTCAESTQAVSPTLPTVNVGTWHG
jgi:hypothetical protein